MNRMIKSWAIALLLGSWLHFAAAQEADTTSMASDMVHGGLQVVQMIDQNKTGEIWDGAAAGAKTHVKRADFVLQIAKVRAPLGGALQRTWVAVNRQVVANGDADLAGQYVSVEYETRFANKAQGTVHELVSFHLDNDQVWRFSGYVLR